MHEAEYGLFRVAFLANFLVARELCGIELTMRAISPSSMLERNGVSASDASASPRMRSNFISTAALDVWPAACPSR
jgi:hypothetical protein